MMDCTKCEHWRRLSGFGGTISCCHYILDTGHARKRDGDECFSWEPKQPKGKREWPLPEITGSTLDMRG